MIVTPSQSDPSFLSTWLSEYTLVFIDALDLLSLPPTFVARWLFVYGCIIWNIAAILSPNDFFVVDGFQISPTSQMTLYMGQLSFQTLMDMCMPILFRELVKYIGTINLDTVTTIFQDHRPFHYTWSPSQQDHLDTVFLGGITESIRQYLISRDQDGWKNANTPVPLPNDGYSIVTQNPDLEKQQDLNLLPQPLQWTPLLYTTTGSTQKYATPRFGDVVNWLSDNDLKDMENTIDAYFPHDQSVFEQEVQNVMSLSSTLTDTQKMIAEFWAGSQSRKSRPPAQLLRLVVLVLLSFQRNDTKTCIMLLCGSTFALFHSAITAWRVKLKYNQARPIQTIRQMYRGTEITTWDGSRIDGSTWTPFQDPSFITPPFPDFVSGHSTFSTSVATWVVHVLHTDSITSSGLTCPATFWMAFTNMFSQNVKAHLDTLSCELRLFPDCSQYAPDTPQSYVTLSWQSWTDIFRQVGISREYGGIHYTSSNYGGQALGTWVSQWLIQMMTQKMKTT